MSAFLHARLALSLVLAVPVVHSANVIVVDAAGGGDFTEIQPAIDASADGDTILVRTGDYAGFHVDDRSLAIVGDIGAWVQIHGTIGISNLEVQKLCIIQNLTATALHPLVPTDPQAIRLENNLGRVRIQHCDFTGASAQLCAHDYLSGGDGIRSRNSTDIALTACTSQGGRSATDGNFSYGIGGSGLSASGSMLTIYDSQFFGGGGGQCYDGTHGGGGVGGFTGSLLFGSNYQARGGNGGYSCSGCGCSYGGDGGNGTSIIGSSQAVLLEGATSQGGYGGGGNPGFGCINTNGHSGVAYYVSDHSIIASVAASARVMTASSPVHAGTVSTLEFNGHAGDQVTLLSSDVTDARYVVDWNGVLLVNPRPPHGTMTSVGTVPSSGLLSIPFPVSDPGVSSKPVYLQPLFTDSQGVNVLGTPNTVIVLQ